MSDNKAASVRTARWSALVIIGLIALVRGNPRNKLIGNPINLREIHEKSSSWTPYKPEEHPFRNLTEDQVRSKFGLRNPQHNKGGVFKHMWNGFENVAKTFGLDVKEI
jgi:hypothetical protein